MDLRPVSLDQLGLVTALEHHARSFSSETLTVEFKSVGFEGERISPAVETALYRIAQEALTNVVRHSHAHTVGILLERRKDRVILFVEDDGIGFDPESNGNGNLGLVGMRERAELLGGTLAIESIAGKGTTIKVEVPNAG
jgi:signal transduction histidine kinase